MPVIELTTDQIAYLAQLQPDLLCDVRSGVVAVDGGLLVPEAHQATLTAIDVSAPAMAAFAKTRLIAYAAEKRWQVETAGITVGGSAIDTSRDSQSMITGAYVFSQANPTKPVRFKAAAGWVTLDAATMAAIATAVGEHVQACFDIEGDVAEAIEDGTITTTAEVDAADWP